MKRLAAVALLALTASPASAEIGNIVQYMNDRTVDAVIISRLAERACDNLVLDAGLAKVALEGTGATLDLLPKEKVAYFAERFAQRPDDGCKYAWSMYGIGAPGDRNPGLRFLHRAIRNPF